MNARSLMAASRACGAWVALAVCCAVARAQTSQPTPARPGVPPPATTRPALPLPAPQSGTVVLLATPERIRTERVLELPPGNEPRLVVVHGSRDAGDPSGDLALFVGDDARGLLSAFSFAPGRFAASLPVRAESRPVLRLRPRGSGLRVERVDVVPAARVTVVLRDQGTKAEVPGIVQVTAVDGSAVPLWGPAGGVPREGAACIAGDGYAEVYVPLGAVVTVAGRASPFRSVDRRRFRAELAEGLLLNLLLGADQLPDGARLLEGPDRDDLSAGGRASVEKIMRIGRRPDGFALLPSSVAIADRSAVLDRALRDPRHPLLSSNERPGFLVPEAVHPFVTVELVGGDLFHSNGPVPLIEGLKRVGDRVTGFLKLRLPAGVNADKVTIRGGETTADFPLSGPATIPLSVVAPAGAPILIVITGHGFSDGSPLETPFAFRVLIAP